MSRRYDVSAAERTQLQARLGSGDLSDAAAVRDVAEATGLSDVEVMAHLRQIRAESGFRLEAQRRAPALPYIAGAALLTGIGVTWWRIQSGELTFSPDPTPQPTTVIPQAPMVVPPAIANLERDYVQTEMLKVPPGFTVEVAGQRKAKVSQYSGAEVRPMPYTEVLESLVRASETLVQAFGDGDGSAEAGTRYMDREGKIFFPRPGQVRVSIDGWSGDAFAYVPVPLTPAGNAEIRKLVVTALGDSKAQQDEALRQADFREGTVSPPPGFNVRFAGRRLDVQNGPRISFSDLPIDAVAKRMETALLNAIYRDGRSPTGAWSGSVLQDTKILRPNLSHVEVTGPGGTVVAEIPTSLGDESAMRAAVKALADRAAKQVESVGQVKP